MTEQEIFDVIVALIKRSMPQVKEITMNTRIMKDLGADSIDMLDIVTEVERKFDIEMTDEEVLNVDTIADACKVVKAHL